MADDRLELDSPGVAGDVSQGAVREQLARVLASDVFASAGRHRRLLQYVVERTLANEGDQLKEYVVATEVFDRPDTYDPRLDTIVRVEARRLRARLQSYYEGPGVGDPVIISIPRGSYVPEFSMRPAPAARPGDGPADPSSPHRRRAAWAGAGLVAAIVLGAAWHLAPAGVPSAVGPAGPGIAVLPFESYSSAPADVLLAARLTDAVTVELAKLETVSVASRTSTSQYARERRSLDEIAAGLRVQFVMEASTLAQAGQLQVMVRLVDLARDRKVWVAEYELWDSEVAAVAPRIAADAAAGAVAYDAGRPDVRTNR